MQVMALGASIATYFGTCRCDDPSIPTLTADAHRRDTSTRLTKENAEIAAGLGRHIDELTPAQLYRFNLSLFIVIHCYNVGLNTVKISFLAQYYRIFPDPTTRRICVCFAFFCFVWMIVQSILYSFSCVPIMYLQPAMEVVCINTLGICELTSSPTAPPGRDFPAEIRTF